MNDYQITLTKRAKDDIIDIGDYIAYTLSEPDTSKNFITGLKASISHLKVFPYKFPLVQDIILESQGIRCMPYKNHYIFSILYLHSRVCHTTILTSANHSFYYTMRFTISFHNSTIYYIFVFRLSFFLI